MPYVEDNLLAGTGDFEVDAESSTGRNATVTQSADQARWGTKSLKVVASSDGTFRGANLAGSVTGLSAGNVLVLSAWVYATVARNFTLNWVARQTDNTFIQNQGTSLAHGGTGWERIYHVATLPALCTKIDGYWVDTGAASVTTGFTFYVDGVRLEMGNAPADYWYEDGFPYVAAAATSITSSDLESHDVRLPSGIQAGDLLIALIASDGSTGDHNLSLTSTPGPRTWTQGWADEFESAGHSFGMRSRIADGSEGATATFTTTGRAERTAHHVLKIRGHDENATVAATRVESAADSTSPNPPDHAPGASANRLWIAAYASDNDPNLTAYPSTFDQGVFVEATGTGSVALGATRKGAAAASLDPGAFTIAASDDWSAATISVEPAGAAGLPARIADWAGVGTTYYVDDAIGSNSNSETQAKSEATPWKTIMHAVDNMVIPATGHVRILVKNGTYRAAGNANAVQATVNFFDLGSRTPSADHVLIIENYPGHTPVVVEPSYTGGAPTTSERHGFWFDDASAKFIRIRGFEVRPFGSSVALNQAQGFRIDATTTDVEIDGCHVHGWKVSGGGSDPRAQGVFVSNGAQRVHVYNAVVHDIGDPAGTSNLEHGFYIGGSSHVLVNCLAYDCRNGFGIQFYEGGGGGSGHVVSHVVTANNKKSGIVVDGTFSVDIRNSIFYDNDEWAVSARASATVTVRNCLSNANGLAGNQGDGYNTEGTSTITRSDNLTGAPLFVDFASRDFRLAYGSPAIGAGNADYTPDEDIDGVARVGSDLGAYEFTFTTTAQVGRASETDSVFTITPVSANVPSNTVAPTVVGSPTVGQLLVCDTGTWTGSPHTYTFQWQRSPDGTTGWTDIADATFPEYVTKPVDGNKFLRCQVRAEN